MRCSVKPCFGQRIPPRQCRSPRETLTELERRVAKQIGTHRREISLKETQLGVGIKRRGKVRDVYELEDRILIVTTDRLSAFDRFLTTIPYKGQVLNQTSAWWFDKTSHLVPNGVLAVPDPNAIVMKKVKVFPVEFVVRGYMTGSTNTSLWTHYKAGERVYCGLSFPDGLRKNDALECPIITPTSKSETHDELLSAEQVVQGGYMTAEEWEETSAMALELFKFGQAEAASHDLILVDTKYEFGKDQDGNILLVDEVHTPDSSRYWMRSSYEQRMSDGEEPESIDKEFIRLWFAQNCDPYNDKDLPAAPLELVTSLSARYIFLYESITGEPFKYHSEQDGEMQERLLAHLKPWMY